MLRYFSAPDSVRPVRARPFGARRGAGPVGRIEGGRDRTFPLRALSIVAALAWAGAVVVRPRLPGVLFADPAVCAVTRHQARADDMMRLAVAIVGCVAAVCVATPYAWNNGQAGNTTTSTGSELRRSMPHDRP